MIKPKWIFPTHKYAMMVIALMKGISLSNQFLLLLFLACCIEESPKIDVADWIHSRCAHSPSFPLPLPLSPFPFFVYHSAKYTKWKSDFVMALKYLISNFPIFVITPQSSHYIFKGDFQSSLTYFCLHSTLHWHMSSRVALPLQSPMLINYGEICKEMEGKNDVEGLGKLVLK